MFSSELSSLSEISSDVQARSFSNQSPSAAASASTLLLLQLVGRRIVARLGAVEQGIALDLFVNETIEFDMRQAAAA